MYILLGQLQKTLVKFKGQAILLFTNRAYTKHQDIHDQESLRMSKTQEKKRARGSSSTVEEDVTDKMILEKLSNIHADVKGSKDELKSEIQALKPELSEVTKSLNAVWDEVQLLKQKNKDIQDQRDATARENSKLNEEISTLKNRVIKLKDYSRRENLRFYNIPENPGESSVECSRKVLDVLSEVGADLENIKFHAIHRTGKPDTSASSNNAVSNGVLTESRERASRPPRPRPILVRFVSRMDSDWAWENRKKLMNSSRSASHQFLSTKTSPRNRQSNVESFAPHLGKPRN